MSDFITSAVKFAGSGSVGVSFDPADEAHSPALTVMVLMYRPSGTSIAEAALWSAGSFFPILQGEGRDVTTFYGGSTGAENYKPYKTFATREADGYYDNWIYLAATWLGDVWEGSINLYTGTTTGSMGPTSGTGQSGTGTAFVGSGSLLIGCAGSLGARPFANGSIAYLAQWNRNLTIEELEQVRVQGPLSLPEGLVLFAGASGNTFVDYGPFGLTVAEVAGTSVSDAPPPPPTLIPGGGVTGDAAAFGGGAIFASGESSGPPNDLFGDGEVFGGGAVDAAVGAKAAQGSDVVGGGGAIAASAEAQRQNDSAVFGGGALDTSGFKYQHGAAEVAGGGGIFTDGTGSVAPRGAAEVFGGGNIVVSGGAGLFGQVVVGGAGGVASDGAKFSFSGSDVFGGGGVFADGEATLPDQIRGSTEVFGGGAVYPFGDGDPGYATEGRVFGGGAVSTQLNGKRIFGSTRVDGGGALFVFGEQTTPSNLFGSAQVFGGGAISDTGIFDEGIVSHYVRGWPVRWDGAVLVKTTI